MKFPIKSKRGEAQEIAYDAMEYLFRDNDKVIELSKKAISIYPDCVDAQILLASLQISNITDYIKAMEEIVVSGKRDLGEECFENDVGHFWGILETRPYMRALLQLAYGYRQMAKYPQAIHIYEEMLRLNPNDDQGVRYILVGCYLTEKDYHKAELIFKKNPNDAMAVFRWGKVLLFYATKNESVAGKELKIALERNPQVLQYIIGKKRLPRLLPDSYSLGDQNEAVICWSLLKEAWKNHPEAKQWLKASNLF